jgi:CheY-like chemotaxis protein
VDYVFWKRDKQSSLLGITETGDLAPAGESRTIMRAPYFVGPKPPGHKYAHEPQKPWKFHSSDLLNVLAILLLLGALLTTILHSVGGGSSIPAAPWEGNIARALGIPDTPPVVKTTAAQQRDIVLVVENDPELRRVALTTLSRHGFTVLLASSGAEAFRVFGSAANEVGLVILGAAPDTKVTRDEIRKVRPNVKVLVSKVPGTLTFAGLGSGILPRPYTAGQLAEAVHKAVGFPSGAGR